MIRDTDRLQEALSPRLLHLLPYFPDHRLRDRERIYPIARGLLGARHAQRQGHHRVVRARNELLDATLHLALLTHREADSDGTHRHDPHQQLHAFLAGLGPHLDDPLGPGLPPWHRLPAVHHFQLAIQSALAVGKEIDRHRGDRSGDRSAADAVTDRATRTAVHLVHYMATAGLLPEEAPGDTGGRPGRRREPAPSHGSADPGEPATLQPDPPDLPKGAGPG